LIDFSTVEIKKISEKTGSPSPDSSGNPFTFSFKSKRLKRIAGLAPKKTEHEMSMTLNW
jgi:hypothetical protein